MLEGHKVLQGSRLFVLVGVESRKNLAQVLGQQWRDLLAFTKFVDLVIVEV
jgi:hypothetical protein